MPVHSYVVADDGTAAHALQPSFPVTSSGHKPRARARGGSKFPSAACSSEDELDGMTQKPVARKQVPSKASPTNAQGAIGVLTADLVSPQSRASKRINTPLASPRDGIACEDDNSPDAGSPGHSDGEGDHEGILLPSMRTAGHSESAPQLSSAQLTGSAYGRGAASTRAPQKKRSRTGGLLADDAVPSPSVPATSTPFVTPTLSPPGHISTALRSANYSPQLPALILQFTQQSSYVNPGHAPTTTAAATASPLLQLENVMVSPHESLLIGRRTVAALYSPPRSRWYCPPDDTKLLTTAPHLEIQFSPPTATVPAYFMKVGHALSSSRSSSAQCSLIYTRDAGVKVRCVAEASLPVMEVIVPLPFW